MTATSNIYPNSIGWSNATYAVGATRINAGNGYRCIVAGTSTVPPTGTLADSAPGGTAHWKWLSSADYTTIQAWWNAIPSTLTQPVVGWLWRTTNPTFTAAAGVAILDSFNNNRTTTTTNTITLQPAPGEGILDAYTSSPTTAFSYNNALGAALECPASGFGGINYIYFDTANVILKGLQIKDSNGSSGATIIAGGGANVVISQCIVDGISQSSAPIYNLTGSGVKILNSLTVDRSVGAPQATFGSNATGLVVANCTFIKTSFATNGRCLDSQTNVTNATCRSVNNIFIGYDRTYGAASAGTPWATNNNAYSQTTFAGDESALDNGGSVFGITLSNTFVSAPTNYHLLTTSACINAGATDTSDIPAANDIFGTSRPQGANWDIGPHELLAGSTVFRDFKCAFEFNHIHMRTASCALETGSNLAHSSGPAGYLVEWLSNQAIDRKSYIEWLSPVYYDSAGQAEWQSNAASVASNSTIPIEWSSILRADGAVQIDYKTALSVGGLSSSAIEWGTPIRADGVSNAAFAASLFISIRANFEACFPITSVNTIVFPEWGTSRGVIPTNVGVGIEWRSGVGRDVSMQIDWRNPTVTTTIPGSLEWTSTIAASITSRVEIERSISANKTVASDHQALTGRDAAVAVESNKSVSASVSFPTEYLAQRNSTANIGVPVEWRRGIFTDQRVAITENTSVSRDVQLSMATSFTISRSVTVSPTWVSSIFANQSYRVEWGHLLLSIHADAGFPLEHLASVFADMKSFYGVDFGRRAIGAQLEPDNWERSHEPPDVDDN